MKRKKEPIKRLSLSFCVYIFVIVLVSPFSLAAQSRDAEKTLNYIINSDETTLVDQVLYNAYQRIGYNITMDAMSMGYAIQMADTGERDGLALQAIGTEMVYTNLVMVPELICDVGFQAFVREGSDLILRSWEDFSGLVVGHMFQKTYIINHLPKDIAGSVQRETFYDLNLALLAGECDVIVTSSSFDQKINTVDGVVYAATVDINGAYTFLNKKHEALVPAVSKALADMKADGTYDKIINGEWRPPGHIPSVLHISSFYAEDLWDNRGKDGIESVLRANGNVSYYNVSLYSNRFRTEYEQAKNAYYSVRTMIMSNPPDVVIASDRSAVSFVCNYYHLLFNGIPIILYDIEGEIDNLWQLGNNYTAIWETVPTAENAAMIKNLFPDTSMLFVVNDHTTIGAAWRTAIEKTLGDHFNGMAVSYNGNLAHADLLAEIAAKPENTAILIGHYSNDAAGIYFSRPQLDSLSMANPSIPVFGMKYSFLGSGQIGGKYVDPISQGIIGGRLALDIILSLMAGNTPLIPDPVYAAGESSRWIFDEAVILSRKIDKGLFPPGAEFINHTPALYESNPQAFIWLVIAGSLGAFIITGLLLFTLVMQRKNHALLETQKSLHTAEELKEAADVANKAKSVFLAQMSHEIRTPMNAILGITEIQLQNETIPPDTKEALEKVYESGDLLLNIINDILDLSKIEEGKLEIVPETYELPNLINDAVQLCRLRYDDKPINFYLDVDKDAPLNLFGDELRIKQIFNNILSNAFKYTEKGEVRVSVWAENSEQKDLSLLPDHCTIVFKVSDTGQGMTAEQLTLLFNEYTRFNIKTNRTIAGTGLGMSITKRLLSLMDGEIFVESEPGKGSVFTVRLPQKRVDSRACGSGLAEKLRTLHFQSTAMYKRNRIFREYMPYGSVLVVDDVESNIYVAKGLLRPYGLEVDTASGGFEAIEKIRNGKVYDIVFMDHMMPDMDGIETTRRLRESGYADPIIALTANAVAGQADIFLQSGFDSFLSKPIDIHQLNEALNKLVRDKQPPEVIEAARREAKGNKTGGDDANLNAWLLDSFVRDARKAMEIFEKLCVGDDTAAALENEELLRKFTVTAHGIKSALGNIGEKELSETAKKLEAAGKERNIGGIQEALPGFMEKLKTLTEQLEPEQDEGGEYDGLEGLREKLLEIKGFCADYDRKSALDAITEARKCSKEARAILEKITELVIHSDFDEAAAALSEYAGTLGGKQEAPRRQNEY